MSRKVMTLAVLGGMLFSLFGAASVSAITFDDPAFETTWMRTDQPVAEGAADRTWIWGPGPKTAGQDEQYAESPNGTRRVQYFDKSRMEITYPNAEMNDIWYVTNGLLVTEMVTGQMQLGDATFEQHEPANQNVGGDQGDDPASPTYATVAGLLGEPATPVGTLITQEVDRAGTITDNPDTYANAGVTSAYMVAETGHSVASVFWDFMNSSGIIADNGTTSQGQLFPNPFYATGFPIIEPYWTTIYVGGVQKDVLMQCFERRCLTYTPTNEPGWQVEAGNVGLHYLDWRYGAESPVIDEASIYLVALEDGGVSGPEIGCGDSLIEVDQQIDASRGPVVGALEALLSLDSPMYGQSGLYTALSTWDVSVDSVDVVNGMATVNLSGDFSIAGVCDNPRIKSQLEQTVLQFPEVDQVEIFVNGTTLDDVLSLM